MGSQLISNAARSLFLAMVLAGLLTGSVAEAASYQRTDGTIIDPILDRSGITHFHSGPNLEPGADLSGADLTCADLYGADLTDVYNVETSTGSPYYYGNTLLPFGFDPVAQGWRLAPYCDFTSDAACNLADINQMFHAGNLVTGVTTSGTLTDWTWLITTPWTRQASRSGSRRQLPQTATVHPICVVTPNLTATWTSLTSMCWPVTSIPRGMGTFWPRFGMKAILMVTTMSTLPISIFWPPILPHPAMPRRPYPNHPPWCFCSWVLAASCSFAVADRGDGVPDRQTLNLYPRPRP